MAASHVGLSFSLQYPNCANDDRGDTLPQHVSAYGVLGEVKRAEPKLRLFCPPEGVIRNEAVAAFVSWTGADPAHAAMPAIEGVTAFPTQTYPCPEATNGSRSEDAMKNFVARRGMRRTGDFTGQGAVEGVPRLDLAEISAHSGGCDRRSREVGVALLTGSRPVREDRLPQLEQLLAPSDPTKGGDVRDLCDLDTHHLGGAYVLVTGFCGTFVSLRDPDEQ